MIWKMSKVRDSRTISNLEALFTQKELEMIRMRSYEQCGGECFARDGMAYVVGLTRIYRENLERVEERKNKMEAAKARGV